MLEALAGQIMFGSHQTCFDLFVLILQQVASVKLGQEASEAAAAAVLEARATGASEEEVKAAAAAAAAEAASKSELMSRSRHHVGDAQSRYYRWDLSIGGLGGVQAHPSPECRRCSSRGGQAQSLYCQMSPHTMYVQALATDAGRARSRINRPHQTCATPR